MAEEQFPVSIYRIPIMHSGVCRWGMVNRVGGMRHVHNGLMIIKVFISMMNKILGKPLPSTHSVSQNSE